MSEQLLESVRSNYGAVAESTLSNEHAGVQAVAQAFGYSAEELTSIPADANMGLSCGNPTAIASIRPGEVVVDLGSGGGLDVLLASPLVGPTGKAIGIDMTLAMIERVRANALSGGYQNVEFYLGTIDKLPLPDASVDCVISNCVINLAPDKPAVFREIARVLKPGGRLAALRCRPPFSTCWPIPHSPRGSPPEQTPPLTFTPSSWKPCVRSELTWPERLPKN